MKEKTNNKKPFVLLFNENQQGFHNSRLGWDCASEMYGTGWNIIAEAEGDSETEHLLRKFSTYYRANGFCLNAIDVGVMVDDYINNNI